MPQVFNKHHGNQPSDAVYCGRGSKYGNPFAITKEHNRDYVCDRFEKEILPNLDVSELRNRDLLCFCAPLRCHCDAILRKANPPMIDLTNAVVYDIETFPNVFTLHMEMLHSDVNSTWEISEFRDDRLQLFAWFEHLRQTQTPMISFNGIWFDYPVIHFIYRNPQCTVAEIYAFAQNIINSNDRFGNTIWESDRFAPQIDLFKIHHFDNQAKRTSLKALQFNMRAKRIVETPLEFGTRLSHNEVGGLLIPYNIHDVTETKRFAHYSMSAIKFRLDFVEQFGLDVLNWNDSKIGSKILEKRLGDNACFKRENGRKVPRQTWRNRIALSDVIFPYIRFNNPEFQRVHAWMNAQVLTPDDLEDENSTIETKGVFKGIQAQVGGLTFKFGTGGIHASISPQHVRATDEWLIRDIDVTGLYPSIAIVNKLAPEHLGEAFTREYAQLPIERAKFKKGTSANGIFKLGSNGIYGNSNNKFHWAYDPKFTMTITINGQLMLCMLAEQLLTVPTLKLIQANTDGITYYIHKDFEPQAVAVCKAWQAYTLLQLEDQNYSDMWIRDVNNYIARDTKGKLKQKGAYWHPDPARYADSISEAGPPAWHKDLGNVVSIKAAVAAMTQGIDPETFIRLHTDPYDFMCRIKVDRNVNLYLGNRELQRTTRYYIAVNGQAMRKVSPPPKGATLGDYCRKNKLTDQYFNSIAATNAPGAWDERIHTKNKSIYQMRTTDIQAGWKICECNDVADFDFRNVNYYWYLSEARKLII